MRAPCGFVWKPEHFKYQGYGGAIKFLEKYILISWSCALLEVRASGKVVMEMLVCSVLIIRCLNSQSKFQMFTLFSGRHIGVLRSTLHITNLFSKVLRVVQ